MSIALPPALSVLGEYRQFFPCEFTPDQERPGKTCKWPVNRHDATRCNAFDPVNWMSAAEAYAYSSSLNARAANARHFGIGFAITPDTGLWCHDIDNCVGSDGQWLPAALKRCQELQGVAVEASHSGRGLHIWGRCSEPIPEHATRHVDASSGIMSELYSRNRFIALGRPDARGSIAVTRALPALLAELFPRRTQAAADSDNWTTEAVADWSGPNDDDELIRRMLAARPSARQAFGDAARFSELWNADPTALAVAFPPAGSHQIYDASRADAALASQLAWWTGNNCARIMRLMNRSALARQKWERPDYIRRTILKACASVAQQGKWYRERGTVTDPESTPTQPVIRLTEGNLHSYAAEAERVLADTVYVRGGALVRIGCAGELQADAAELHRDQIQAVCIPVTCEWIRRELTARVTFAKFDARRKEWQPRDCPVALANNIAGQGDWQTFRPLTAIASAPFLRSDASVCETPGYDAATGIYCRPSTAFPSIPLHPTRDDAAQALARLLQPFDEFPFASEASRAVFAAHVLTACIRATLDTTPIFVYTAPIAATGKTLAASIASRIATGTPAAVRPYSDEGEELRKALFASLLAGDAALTFDNVPSGTKVRSSILCAFVTAPTYTDRKLGVSESPTMPNRCIVTLTGNNITPTGDVARRALVCRLDTNAESPRGRSFKVPDLPAYIRERRASLLVDALVIIRAYALAGRPLRNRPLESFEQWSTLVRDPLLWLNLVDPVETQQTDADDEIAPLRDAFASIAQFTQNNGCRFTASTLSVGAAGFGAAAGVNGLTLRDALIAAGCSEPTNAQKLGYWLRGHKGRVAGDWKLTCNSGKVSQWELQHISQSAAMRRR